MNDSHPRSLKRVIIIGGGITGLAAAHRLVENFAATRIASEILLLEASGQVGGVIRTDTRDGFVLEAGPDAFISEKPEALNLARRIGLDQHLIQTNDSHRRSFVVRSGRLLPVPEGFQLLAPSSFWPFITSDIFSWSGKARMALDLVIPRRRNTNNHDDESLASFVRRRLGHEALARIAQPMVGGIYTADPELLSLRSTMPRFLEMEQQHRSLLRAMWRARKTQTKEESASTSGARYSLFLSFVGGMQMLTDELSRRMPVGSIRLNTRVDGLHFDEPNNRWQVRTSNGESLSADAVCVALPAFAAARLIRSTDRVVADELEAIPYASTATVNLAYRREDVPHPLNGFGFVVPFIERRSLLACSFSSVKFAGRAPEGRVLLRAFVGGALQPEMFAMDDKAMLVAVRKDLRDLLGIEKPPLFSPVQKWERSMAQYHVGHSERVARIRSGLASYPSLQFAGNAFSGAGIPDCIRNGESAAEEIFATLSMNGLSR